jgi:hypothetical protein
MPSVTSMTGFPFCRMAQRAAALHICGDIDFPNAEVPCPNSERLEAEISGWAAVRPECACRYPTEHLKVATRQVTASSGGNISSIAEVVAGTSAAAASRDDPRSTFARWTRLTPVPLAPVPLAPVPLAPVPLAPVPLAPVPLAPLPLANVGLGGFSGTGDAPARSMARPAARAWFRLLACRALRPTTGLVGSRSGARAV